MSEPRVGASAGRDQSRDAQVMAQATGVPAHTPGAEHAGNNAAAALDERASRQAEPRAKLGTRVADDIRDAIMSGAFVPGQKLVMDDLAQWLGVSSMPVREAMVALANEGLLDVYPRRGFAVAPIARTDIDDIVLVHAFVAGSLAERAAPVIGDTEIALLRSLQQRIHATAAEGLDDSHRAAIGDLNYAFHRTVNRLVDSPRLFWFLRAVGRYVPRRVYETVPGWAELAVAEHPALIEAFAANDARAARALTEEHVRHSGAKLIEHLEARGFWR